jgi:hypothetical protein
MTWRLRGQMNSEGMFSTVAVHGGSVVEGAYWRGRVCMVIMVVGGEWVRERPKDQ